MVREFYDEINALIPYKAHSAFTLMAMGTDKIIMGRKGELSPIDPSIKRFGSEDGDRASREIGVEDISSYLTFVKERAGLSDQSALTNAFKVLGGEKNKPHSSRKNRKNLFSY